MEAIEIIKNKTAIAAFMGMTVYPRKVDMNKPVTEWSMPKSWKGEHSDFEPWHMKYHTSWDWLMPVVEKIEGLKFSRDMGTTTVTWHYDVKIKRNYCIIKPDTSFASVFLSKWDFKSYDGKLKGTFNACVEFIKWYNPQTT